MFYITRRIRCRSRAVAVMFLLDAGPKNYVARGIHSRNISDSISYKKKKITFNVSKFELFYD